MSGNLPPGTTHADIDAHYAPPETQIASGAVDVGVDVEVNSHMDHAEIEQALADAVREALDMEDERIVEIHGVRIGEVYEQ